MNDQSRVVFFAMLSVSVLTPLAWLPIWLQDRQHKAVLWGMLAAFTFTCSITCRVSLPFLWAIAIANLGILIAHGLIWVACGSLRKRTPAPIWVIIPPTIWVGLCFVGAFRENVNLRMFVFGIMAAGLNALSMHEIWQIKVGRVNVKSWLLGVLGIEIIVKVVWAVWVLTQPVARGVEFSTIPGFITMLFGISGFILLIGPALVALDKELSDIRQHDMARKDFMTGIGNRRYLEEELIKCWKHSISLNNPLSIIMIDVDRFKEYNDHYGHPAGDRCLQTLVDALKLCCRSGDIVGRYGGEEFAVLLPATRMVGGLEVAQRMLLEVRKLQLEHCLAPNGIVTISIGVASTYDFIVDMTPAELIKLADLALYKAKNAGRDRVHATILECPT